MKLYDVLQV